MRDLMTLSFTEEMKGFVALGGRDHEDGFVEGKKAGLSLMFHLTITAADVDRFLADPRHEAEAVGWVESERLGGRLPVERGIFNLFVDTEDPRTTHMRYHLQLAGADGQPLTLVGFKVVRDDPGFDVWADTSTLYTTVYRGAVEAGRDSIGTPEDDPLAVGILRIHMSDFARQLTTFRVEGGNLASKVGALSRFGVLFLGKLWETYAPSARKAVEES
jgi:cholesterol oxidase